MENNWTMTYNQEAGATNGNFLASNIVAGIQEEETIGTIKLKIREDVKATTTVIKFKEIKSNDGETLVEESDKSIIIKIVEDTEESSNNNGTNSSSNIIVSTETSEQDESTSPNKLPQTGKNSIIYITITIASIVAIVVWEKYKNIEIK